MLRLRRPHAESYGWEEQQGRPRRSRLARAFTALGVLVVTAAITAFVGSLFSPGFAYRASNAAVDVFRAPPSASAEVTDAYMADTRAATFWARRPVMFPNSATYMRTHFSGFDPRRSHRYVESKLKLWVPDLLHMAPGVSGVPIETFGQLVTANMLSPPFPPGNIEWVLQLRPITTEGGLVYCRLTRPVAWRPKAGALMRARGLVIAAGPISLANGGLTNGVYLACSAIAGPPVEFAGLANFLRTHPQALELFRKSIKDPALARKLRKRWGHVPRKH
jgi:hypothetical protein